jgi:uncharacterized protein (TIGR01244 family)
LIESNLSIAVRRTAGIVMMGALVLVLSQIILGWPRVSLLFGVGGWVFGYATLIVHLETTKVLTETEKSLWRDELFGWRASWRFSFPIATYLFSRDLGRAARGFAQRDASKQPVPMSGVEEIYIYRKVNEKLATSGQPTEEQLHYVAREGFEVVINLALHGDPRYSLKDETASVTSLGMKYIHIPVDFQSPTESDLQTFFAAMDAHRHQKVLVHCAANKRVTAFVGLYRINRLGWPADKAFALMHSVWEPDPVWSGFISQSMKKDFS